MKSSGKVGNWQWTTGQISVAISITVWIHDCFPPSSLLGDMESGINWLRCETLQCWACSSRHHSNYDVIMSPALGGGMQCPSASSIETIKVLITWLDCKLITAILAAYVNSVNGSYSTKRFNAIYRQQNYRTTKILVLHANSNGDMFNEQWTDTMTNKCRQTSQQWCVHVNSTVK